MKATNSFAETLKHIIVESEKYETCMSLIVSDEGKSVELTLDTGRDTYGQWIEGEGGDICLLRCQTTDKVVGVHLPLMNRRLYVGTNGPVKINKGYRKDGREDDESLIDQCARLWYKMFLVGSVIVGMWYLVKWVFQIAIDLEAPDTVKWMGSFFVDKIRGGLAG